MKYQRQLPTSFGPRQHSTSKKKAPGPLMMKIIKEVQRSQTYMQSSAPSRNTGANRGDDVENIGFARDRKTYDMSKSVHANQGQDNVMDVKPPRFPLGDNMAMANGSIFPLGKSKKSALSPSLKDFEKLMPSRFRDDFSSEGSEKLSPHILKDNSSGTNGISKKPLCKRKVVASSKGLISSVDTPFVPDNVKDVASTEGNVVGHGVHFVDEHHKEQSLKEKEHKNPSSKSKRRLEQEDLGGNSDAHLRMQTSCMVNNMKRNGGPAIENYKTDNENLKSNKGKGLLEKMPRKHADGIEEPNVRQMKRRRYIPPVDEDEDDISGDDQNLNCGDNRNTEGVEDGTEGLASQTAIVKQYGSLPIDEPIWSGMLKIGSDGYISLGAHLLAKSCEKVWECSRSLQKMVQVTKLSRLEAEPKCFRVSRPTEDNIGLYFFPQGMRPNEDFDKLVKEVMDDDLILQATLDEAEMLILHSILLPERHQTFQGKHYLWGLFKRREDKVNVEGETHMRGTCPYAHEKENGKECCSRPRVGKKGIDKERRTASLASSNAAMRPADRAAAQIAAPAAAATAATSHAQIATPAAAVTAATSHATSSTQRAERPVYVAASLTRAATSRAPFSTRPAERAAAEGDCPAPTAMSHAPSSIRPAERAAADAATPAPASAERAAAEADSPAPAAMSHAPSSIPPAERAAADAATPAPAPAPAPAITTSHGPSLAVPHGGMYGFIVRPNPRIQQLIQEMANEGAVVFAMRGETIGYGLSSQ